MAAKKSQGEGSAPFLHLSKGHDALAYPAQSSEQSDQFGYGYSEDNFRPEVNGKDKERQDKQGFFTLSVLDGNLAGSLPIEMSLTRMFGDPLGQDLAEKTAQATVGHKGRGRQGIEKMMAGAAPKVSVPTTITQRVRKLWHKGSEEGEYETEVGNDQQ